MSNRLLQLFLWTLISTLLVFHEQACTTNWARASNQWFELLVFHERCVIKAVPYFDSSWTKYVQILWSHLCLNTLILIIPQSIGDCFHGHHSLIHERLPMKCLGRPLYWLLWPLSLIIINRIRCLDWLETWIILLV